VTPLVIPIAAALGWCGIQVIGQRLIFPRSRTFRAGPEDTDLEVEDIEFCAEDGTALHGWWFPKKEAKGVLLVCHGNAGNVSDRIWIAEDLRDVPVEVFVFDYRGYGKSSGVPSEKGTRKDVLAAYEVVRSRAGGSEIPPVVVYGRSLGGAIALQLACEMPVRGVILESTFRSIVDIGKQFYPYLFPALTCRHPYRSDLRIQQVEAPILAAHSPEDETVPFDIGKRLYDTAPHLWRFCMLQGNHVEAGWQTSPAYADAVREFIGDVL
jgi:fermentation-respiration switch protein FrsA (DUF1100 family)